MHNLQLSDEQSMVQETVAKFVQDVAAPKALELDEHRQFAGEVFAVLAETGLLGAAVGEDAGGAGLGLLSLVVALEEIAQGCTSTARLFLTQGGIVARALEGIDAAGEALGAVLMGESLVGWVGPENGVRAARDGDGWVLDGTADHVTAATEAKQLLVAAVTEDGTPVLALVDAGVATVEPTLSLGFRATAPGRVTFASAAVAADAVLAEGDAARDALRRAELAALVGGAALATGSALASAELGRKHTEERIAFGKPLARQQAVGHKLTESLRRAHAARHLAWHAARLADAGEDAFEIGRMARLSALDAAVYSADESIQVHGGYGFTVEYHVERHYRDAKTLEVLDGGALALRDELTRSLAALA